MLFQEVDVAESTFITQHVSEITDLLIEGFLSLDVLYHQPPFIEFASRIFYFQVYAWALQKVTVVMED